MRTRVYLIAAAAAWCLLIIAAPMLAAGDGVFHMAGNALYVFFAPVCHQWDSHSFHLFGEKLPVCIRCSAVYGGFLCGIILYPALGYRLTRRMSSRVLWSIAVAGMLADVTLSIAGIAPSTTATRVLTGGIFGVAAAFVLTPMLHELIDSCSAGAGRT